MDPLPVAYANMQKLPNDERKKDIGSFRLWYGLPKEIPVMRRDAKSKTLDDWIMPHVAAVVVNQFDYELRSSLPKSAMVFYKAEEMEELQALITDTFPLTLPRHWGIHYATDNVKKKMLQ